MHTQHVITRCRRCDRPLTDRLSLKRGYGHECWDLMKAQWEQQLDLDPFFPPRTYSQRTLPSPPRPEPHYVVVPREALEEVVREAEWALSSWDQEPPSALLALRGILATT